jgi:hypothetical protein
MNYSTRRSSRRCQRSSKSESKTWQTSSLSQTQGWTWNWQQSPNSRAWRARYRCWPHGWWCPIHTLTLDSLFLVAHPQQWLVKCLSQLPQELKGDQLILEPSRLCGMLVESGTFEISKLALWPVSLWISGACDTSTTVLWRAVEVVWGNAWTQMQLEW